VDVAELTALLLIMVLAELFKPDAESIMALMLLAEGRVEIWWEAALAETNNDLIISALMSKFEEMAQSNTRR
jgi:hypothetical protein